MRFRGSIAPASLKPIEGAHSLHHVEPFPGLYCPGLIEAPAVDASATPPATVSGALLPRPH